MRKPNTQHPVYPMAAQILRTGRATGHTVVTLGEITMRKMFIVLLGIQLALLGCNPVTEEVYPDNLKIVPVVQVADYWTNLNAADSLIAISNGLTPTEYLNLKNQDVSTLSEESRNALWPLRSMLSVNIVQGINGSEMAKSHIIDFCQASDASKTEQYFALEEVKRLFDGEFELLWTDMGNGFLGLTLLLDDYVEMNPQKLMSEGILILEVSGQGLQGLSGIDDFSIEADINLSKASNIELNGSIVLAEWLFNGGSLSSSLELIEYSQSVILTKRISKLELEELLK